MAKKLTSKQRDTFAMISKHPLGKIRQHVKRTGTVCFRLLDEKLNPITNIRSSTVDRLEAMDLIERQGHDFVLCATVD